MSAARNIFMRVALLGTIAVLGLASPASAEVDPAVTTRPTISSTPLPYVGNTLTASGGNTSPAGITTGYVWLRCESASESRCGMDDVIDGANASTYKLTSADLNQYIRVAKYACRYCPWDLAYQLSDPAKKVTAAPTPTPTPTRTPTPTPTPTKTPTPSPTPAKTPTPSPTPAKTPTPTPTPTRTPTPTPTKAPVVNVTPTPAPTEDVQIVDQISTGGFAVDAVAQPEPTPVATRGEVLAATESKGLRMLKPFPLVRISGVLTAGGAKISILTVRAPKGARIAVRCDGRGCPVRKVAQVAKLVHIKQFERELTAGVKLTVSISKRGYFTKVTTITIRKGKAPLRSDQCQRPGTAKLSRCPR